jgi:hypothetical protein
MSNKNQGTKKKVARFSGWLLVEFEDGTTESRTLSSLGMQVLEFDFCETRGFDQTHNGPTGGSISLSARIKAVDHD